ncbi:hypothetical protein [Streptococcus marmotae]|uniref:hypothetical protein n=1 Tax=Streptococcus marmotae TaxID=1825069 RepID=UPI000832EF20|nr:hypothetical protein [Streptococcus marmotae]
MLQKNVGLMVVKNQREKAPIVVDMMCNLLDVAVHTAKLHDTKSRILVTYQVIAQLPTIKAF